MDVDENESPRKIIRKRNIIIVGGRRRLVVVVVVGRQEATFKFNLGRVEGRLRVVQ